MTTTAMTSSHSAIPVWDVPGNRVNGGMTHLGEHRCARPHRNLPRTVGGVNGLSGLKIEHAEMFAECLDFRCELSGWVRLGPCRQVLPNETRLLQKGISEPASDSGSRFQSPRHRMPHDEAAHDD